MGRKIKQYGCKYCGSTNPGDFYGASKSTCRVCMGIKIKARPYYNSKRNKEQASTWSRQNIIRSRWLQARYRAKTKHLEFGITEDDIRSILDFQSGRCHYSGIEFDNDDNRKSMSIDRIDSKGGYIKDNIRLVCTEINYMKGDMSEQEFITLLSAVYENLTVLGKN